MQARLRKYNFPKEKRLSRSSEFLLVKQKGETFKGRFMILGVLKSESAAAGWRVGIITSRKVGGAVERNRVRRRFRELARLDLPRPDLQTGGGGISLVMVARRAAVDSSPSWEELRREWRKLLRRAGIVPPPQGEGREGATEGGNR